jgi:hypothetical protein
MLRVEETAIILRILAKIVSSRGQPTRGDPKACGVGPGLTIPHRKKPACYEVLTQSSVRALVNTVMNRYAQCCQPLPTEYCSALYSK